MATLDVQIDPSAARRGARVVVNSLEDISNAAVGATAIAGQLGTSFGRSLGVIQTALGVLGGPLRAIATLGAVVVANLAVSPLLRDYSQLTRSFGDIAAITGALGADLQFLATQARDFGAASVFASEEAARALTLTASARPALLDNLQGLSTVTDDVLLLGEAAGIDLPLAAQAAGQAMNQFNLVAADSSRVVNTLAAGAKFGASEIATTAEALGEAGVVAARANVSFEELNAAIQILAAGGVSGGRAGTALRNLILGLQLGAEEFSPVTQGLVSAITEVGDASLSTAEQLQLVGREGITALSILTSAGGDFEDLTRSITGTTVAAEQAEARFDNLAGRFTRLDSAGAALSETLGQYFAPFVSAYVRVRTVLTEALNDFARLDNALLRRSGVQAEQIVGTLDNSAFSAFVEIVRTFGSVAQSAFGVAQSGLDSANLSAESFSVSVANLITNLTSIRSAERLVGIDQVQLAQEVEQAAEREVDHRNAILAAQIASAGVIRGLDIDAGAEQADARLQSLNAQVVAEAERNRLIEERQSIIAAGLDPLRDIETGSLEENLAAAAGFIESSRTDAEQLEVTLQRIQALGDRGLFSPDADANASETQRLIEGTRRVFEEQEAERERQEQLRQQREQDAINRSIEREERAAQRRLEILQREREQRRSQARSLVDQYAPLVALELRRNEVLARANQLAAEGVLSNDNLAKVIEGLGEAYARQRDELTGVAAAQELVRSIQDRFLPDQSAQRRYIESLRDISAANLSTADAERAKSAALEQYQSALRATEEPLDRLVEQQRRIAEEGARQFEEFSSSVSGALASFITGTENAITSFLQNLAQQILQAQLQATVVSPLLSAFGGVFGATSLGGGGGIFGSVPAAPAAGPIVPRQFGGTTQPGRNYVVGENGPELLSQGAGGGVVTPLPQQGGLGTGVTVNVNNLGSPDNVSVNSNRGPNGEQVIDITVSDSLRRQSDTGELDRTMGFYGGRRGLIPAG